MVHRCVRVLQQRLCIDAVVGIDADADARRDVDVEARQGNGPADIGKHAARNGFGIVQPTDFVDEDHEFIAGQSRERVGPAQSGCKAPSRFLEQFISAQVSQ